MPAEERKPMRRRLIMLAIALAMLVGLAAAWSWSPLHSWLDVDRIVGGLRLLGQTFGPFAAIAGFALACLVAMPMTFLALVTIVAFGPMAGFFYSLAGACLGAAGSYGLGRFLGHEVLERYAGERLRLISRRLARHGILAVISVRMVPVAPFAVINMVAGASHISLRDMVLGTAIGMTPGTLAMIFFVDQIVGALKNPGPGTILVLVMTLGLIALGLWGLRRWLRVAGKN